MAATLGKAVVTSAASGSLWVVAAAVLSGSKFCFGHEELPGRTALRKALPEQVANRVPLAGFSWADAVDTAGAVGDSGGGKSSDSFSPGNHKGLLGIRRATS